MAPATAEKLKAQFPDVEYIKLPSAAEHPHFNWGGFKPGLTAIPKGHIRSPGLKAFSTDVLFDRDVAIPMRDEIKIYADDFRPVNSDTAQVPALIP
jgi:predicted acyl esterase